MTIASVNDIYESANDKSRPQGRRTHMSDKEKSLVDQIAELPAEVQDRFLLTGKALTSVQRQENFLLKHLKKLRQLFGTVLWAYLKCQTLQKVLLQ